MLSVGVLLMLACAVVYYKIGELEYRAGFRIAGLSVGLWLAVEYLLGWGWGGALLGQVGLFVALTAWNMKRPTGRKGSG